MAILVDTLPYLLTQQKRVALPRNDTTSNRSKLGYGNLVFMFTNSVDESIDIINNKNNLYNDNKYYYYYYNLHYRGTIAGRRYNIKNVDDRKRAYEKIKDKTTLTPHPPSLLNKTQNRNCYFEMSKYFEIYKYMTKNFTLSRKMNIFWSFFKSVWFSEQTSTYDRKWVLIDADMFNKFSNMSKDNADNPLFMIYYTLYKNYELIKDINIDFIIYCKKAVLRFNPSYADDKTHKLFKRELQKVFSKVSGISALNEQEIDKNDQKEELKENLTKKFNFVGNEVEKDEVTEIKGEDKKETKKVSKEEIKAKTVIDEKIDKKIENISKSVSEIIPDGDETSKEVKDYIQTQTEIELDDDKELIENIYNVMKTQKTPTTPLSSARDKRLREAQEQIKIDGMTLKDLNKINASKMLVPEKNISKSIKNINKNMKTVKFANLNKEYIEKAMPVDIMNMFTCLNTKSNKFYVVNVDVKDTSDSLNYKETYKVTLKDEEGQRHILTVDIPKFLDNKFMFLGENKKIINRQNFLYPVVKTAPDTVQIVTNYNKMFIRRIGTKSISSVERIMKLISSNDECFKYFTVGNNSNVNKSFITTIEYDEFGKVISKFKTDNCTLFFNQKEATDYAEENNINIPRNHMFIGVKNKKSIFIDVDTQLTDKGENICDLLFAELPESLQTEFNKIRSTKKLMYNTVTIMTQTIPLIVLLLYWEGISTVINKVGLKYHFSTRYPSSVKSNESVIRFKDCYFVYEEDLPTSLLMNGIKVLDTENHNLEEYNGSEAYLDYFKKVYGKIAIINALYNAYEFAIDPITLEILKDINLPTDIVSLAIYASSLLADESYTIENSQTLSRVRSIEIIPAILYNEISRAYLDYKNSAGKKKLSIPRDCVIKKILEQQTVEDYSTLNPVVELEKDRTISSKGFRGVNVDRAYTEEKRSYDESMIGIIAMNTSPDGNVGINRFLTMEPEITSLRGYVDIKMDRKEELKDVNLFSPAELLYPLGNTRDDPVRIAMACKQSKHVVPVKNASPALITNGADEAIRFSLSSDFVVNAEEDGTIIDYDEKSQIMIAEYKSGKKRAIDLSPNIVKNGGGGFFLSNVLITNLKVGDKFKKDDVLAWHKDFFTQDKINGLRMNVGTLEKVAIVSSYDTYNDSTMITKKLAKDSVTSMTFCKQIVVGKNSNIYNMKNVGDTVSIGDSLIDFDTSFDDSDLNKLLSHLSDENKEVLEEGSINSIKSKYAGHIVDVKIYSTLDIPELSPSLQKIVKNYYNRVNNKKKFVSQYDPDSTSIVKCGLLLNESTGKVEPNIYGVIKGQKVEDSVLIEFYIEHDDVMGVGDKLAFFTALKSVIGEVVPEGYEPWSEFRPDEEVSSVISASAILKRQTPSILITLLGNKIVVELKRRLEEIYNS